MSKKENLTNQLSKANSNSQNEILITEFKDKENLNHLSFTKPIRVANTREIKNK